MCNNFEANFFFLLKFWISYVVVNQVYETFLLQYFIVLRLKMIWTLIKTNKLGKETSQKNNNTNNNYCEICFASCSKDAGWWELLPSPMWCRFDSGFHVIHIWVNVYVCRYSHAAPRNFPMNSSFPFDQNQRFLFWNSYLI